MYDIRENKIIIYGAGCCGVMFAELLQQSGLRAECFFDRNVSKAGKNFMGVPVMQPMLLDMDSLVVVCILKKGRLYEEIEQNIRKIGYKKIVHIYDLRNERWLFRGQCLILVPNKEQVQEHLLRYENLSRHLADEMSCRVLECVMCFLLESADVEFPSLAIEEQYFAYDIYQKISEEYVVDCGAFKGDVMRIFLKKNKDGFAHYFAIEPDNAYLPFLQPVAEQYEDGKVEIKSCALSDRRETLRMRNYAGEDSVVRDDGEVQVQAYCLDELLEDRICTFLKIDVEGYDKKTIRGAEKVIQEQRPVVAVATYHGESDFYEIFELLKGLYEDYYFYLRSYMNIQETVLYAVPPWRLVKEKEDEVYR